MIDQAQVARSSCDPRALVPLSRKSRPSPLMTMTRRGQWVYLYKSKLQKVFRVEQSTGKVFLRFIDKRIRFCWQLCLFTVAFLWIRSTKERPGYRDVAYCRAIKRFCFMKKFDSTIKYVRPKDSHYCRTFVFSCWCLMQKWEWTADRFCWLAWRPIWERRNFWIRDMLTAQTKKASGESGSCWGTGLCWGKLYIKTRIFWLPKNSWYKCSCSRCGEL